MKGDTLDSKRSEGQIKFKNIHKIEAQHPRMNAKMKMASKQFL